MSGSGGAPSGTVRQDLTSQVPPSQPEAGQYGGTPGAAGAVTSAHCSQLGPAGAMAGHRPLNYPQSTGW